jgi:hypothetical protein
MRFNSGLKGLTKAVETPKLSRPDQTSENILKSDQELNIEDRI